MRVCIERRYFTNGVNGSLTIDGLVVCKTIELPWKDNAPRISCIPAGNYALRKRYSIKFGWHLHVQHIPGRSLILIHPANNAIKELQGCIAPVTLIMGEGIGYGSKQALQLLVKHLEPAFAAKDDVLLTIGPAF